MGAPGYAYFCKNGHLVHSVAHHMISDYEPKKCWCGCQELALVWEFEDERYTQIVPTKPLYFAYRHLRRENQYVKFFVYDVSRIPEEDWRLYNNVTKKKTHRTNPRRT